MSEPVAPVEPGHDQGTAQEGAHAPSASAAMTAGASLSSDTRSVTLGGDDRPMDEEAGLRGDSDR